MRGYFLTAVLALAMLPAAAQAAEPQGQSRQREQMRFRNMDRNNDGVISREEWRGSVQSFRAHDWNGDGRLSGDEVQDGAVRRRDPDADWTPQSRPEFYDWNETGFTQIDRNRDGRITPAEWRYDPESFRRADRNGDDELSRNEFLNAESDLDREDRFDYLDANQDGRLERAEWHGSLDAFQWLDRNRDGALSRAEVVGQDTRQSDLFASLDRDDDGRVSADEWHWSRRSFNRQDANGDGVLSRTELSNSEIDAVGTTGRAGQPRVVTVDATVRWVDTGIDVRAGDVVAIEAQGNVRLSLNGNDYAGPAGASTGRRAEGAPLPEHAAGALIARIGQSNPIMVGQRVRLDSVQNGGRLFLSVNDDHLADNEGEFRVTITIQR